MPAQAIAKLTAGGTLFWLVLMNGASVSTLYWAQSLVARAAAEFGASPLVGLMPGASLAGYAAGVALLASVARDLTSPRGLLLHLLVLAGGLCLVACAPAPAIATLACLIIGLGCSLTQRLLACAVSSVAPEARSQTIGWIIGGGLCGIVLARACVPMASAWFGWRSLFWADAIIVVVLGSGATFAADRAWRVSSQGVRPPLAPASVLWRREKRLRRAAIEQAIVFAAFNLGWAVYPRLLASDGIAPMLPMGIVAGLGAGAAIVAGRVCARWEPDAVARSGLVAAVFAIAALLLAGRMFPAYGPAMALLDTGTQVALVANQARAQALASSPAMRGRVAAMITTLGFAGGALGAALGNLML